MTDGCVYVLDANVFIEAAKRYYAFDIAPGFWDGLVRCGASGLLVSIDRVYDELKNKDDDLFAWVDEFFAPWFTKTGTDGVIAQYRRVIAYIFSEPRFTDAARAAFADGADGWLIAFAIETGCLVVTDEKRAPTGTKVKIPDVCHAFDLQWRSTFQMMRETGIRLA